MQDRKLPLLSRGQWYRWETLHLARGTRYRLRRTCSGVNRTLSRQRVSASGFCYGFIKRLNVCWTWAARLFAVDSSCMMTYVLSAAGSWDGGSQMVCKSCPCGQWVQTKGRSSSFASTRVSALCAPCRPRSANPSCAQANRIVFSCLYSKHQQF